jgi:hypothetical protein
LARWAIASQKGRYLPKWQMAGENCQNGSHCKSCAGANAMPKKIIFQPIFFICYSSMLMYNVDIKRERKREKDD